MTAANNEENTSFLPNFCSSEVLFIVVLSAELLAIILSLSLPLYSRDVLFDLAMHSLFIQWIALTCVGVLCLLRHALAKLTDHQAAFVSYGLILFISFVITELAWWFLYVYPERVMPGSNFHGLFLLRSLGISAIVGAIVLRYLYVQHQWRKNIEAIASSRYQALQSRIRPHFLFNCMNTIASLTRKQPELAEQSIEDLADLFRASLQEQNKLHKFSDELTICETYLRIEKHRLDERLQVNWDISSLPKGAMLPPLTLQPLLENAIYHGIEQVPEGGAIEVKGEYDAPFLKIRISNPLPSKDVDKRHHGNHLAQENIRQRLISVFGEDSQLNIEANDQTYTVSIIIPYEHDEDTDR